MRPNEPGAKSPLTSYHTPPHTLGIQVVSPDPSPDGSVGLAEMDSTDSSLTVSTPQLPLSESTVLMVERHLRRRSPASSTDIRLQPRRRGFRTDTHQRITRPSRRSWLCPANGRPLPCCASIIVQCERSSPPSNSADPTFMFHE